LKKKSRSIQ